MIKHMDMVFINILMVLNMKDNGLKIDKVVKVLKLGLMVLVMLAVIKMGKNAVKENLNGLMDHLMKVIFLIIILMGKVFILGEIKDNILEIGLIIKWKVKEFLLGLIIESIMGIIIMIKKMVLELLNGLMEGNLLVIGKMGNKMVKGNFIILFLVLLRKDYGKMEKELNGIRYCSFFSFIFVVFFVF
jgi:hypothetical protein